MKASPWEKEDAIREGVAIMNFLAPKAFTHEAGRLTGVVFERMAAKKDERGRRVLTATGEPDVVIECDDVLIAVGQENAFPWIESDIGLAFGRDGLPAVDPVTFQSSLPNVFFGGDSAFGPKNIITAVAHGHEAAISIDAFCRDEDPRARPDPLTNLVSQKMGIHEWSYDNAITLDRRFKVPHVENAVALKNIQTEVELGFDLKQALGEAQRCLNCDVQTVFSLLCASSATPASTCARSIASRSCPTRPRRTAAFAHRARAQSFPGDLCLGAGQDPPRHGQGRGSLPALRALRRTLPDRRVGHDEVHNRDGASRTHMPIDAVNDFVIRFANVNGSGSASANLLFARSILRMGVPIGPRNIFPSNIQGLPTWYEVRVSEAGFLGARGGADILVAMNPQTFVQDLAGIEPGGYLFYDSTRPIAHLLTRDDIAVLGMPLTEICTAEYSDPNSASFTRTSSMSARSRRCSTSNLASSRRCCASGSRARTS